MWNRAELKEDSKTLLKLNYWPFVLVAFIHMAVTGSSVFRESFNFAQDDFDFYNVNDYLEYLNHFRYRIYGYMGRFAFAAMGIMLITILSTVLVVLVLQIFVFNPLEIGCKRYMVLSRNVKPEYGEIVSSFRNCYGNVVKIKFLMGLYTSLWSLLLVIPGIVKAYEYRMIPYLLAEYPDMAASEAFRISREMMMGNKWDAFILDLSFLGWDLLSMATVGIAGLLYVWPYQLLTEAALYLTLKKTHPAFGYVKPDDNYYL